MIFNRKLISGIDLKNKFIGLFRRPIKKSSENYLKVSFVPATETNIKFKNYQFNKWDVRFLKRAKEISSWSKDRTKNGSVIVRPDHSVLSEGFNGLVPGMNDDEYLKNREKKNLCIRHSEENAIWYGRREDMSGCTLYHYGIKTCGRCASAIAMTGIKKVICCVSTDSPDWKLSQEVAKDVFDQCGIVVKYFHPVDI